MWPLGALLMIGLAQSPDKPGVGPWLNPVQGERIDHHDRAALPSARHLGDVADRWVVQTIDLAPTGGGGVERFEDNPLSAYGASHTSWRLLLNGIDITDPALPGRPAVSVPFEAWRTLDVAALWAPTPTLALRLPASAATRAVLRGGGAVGGGFWLPKGVFDRDPAFAFGAPTDRRALRPAAEVSLSADGEPWGVPLQLDLEASGQRLHLPTLAAHDEAGRIVALAQVSLPWRLTALWQDETQSHAGAAHRWGAAWTHRRRSQAALLQAVTQWPSNVGAWQLALGGVWRQETVAPRGTIVVPVEQTGLYLQTPQLAAARARWRADATLEWNLEPWQGELRLGLARLHEHPMGTRSGRTWRGAALDAMTREHGESRQWLPAGRLELGVAQSWPRWQGRAMAALDYGGARAPGAAVGLWAAAIGAAATVPLAGGELYTLVRREPLTVTAEVARFIDPKGPSATTRPWQDTNANGVPDADDTFGALTAAHGGTLHHIDSALRRPADHRLALGYRTPSFARLRLSVQGVARWLTDPFTVHGRGGEATAVPLNLPDSEVTTVYAETPPTAYVLANGASDAYFLGTEVQLASEGGGTWDVNLMGAAYLSPGRAPFGSFPDRNDPGIVDEAAAGANQSLNAYGRYDHDRSFSLKLLAVWRPMKRFAWSLAARYRDGQPFTRIAIVENLPQGPTPIMALPRGRVRHTFHMAWDTRLRYALGGDFPVAFVVDVFNLWGSATEILEDPRPGRTWRRALEASPDRAVFVSIELGNVPS